jgi:hypothetical protein
MIVLIMEAVQTSETSVNSRNSTRSYNPEDSHLHSHRLENLKSYLNTEGVSGQPAEQNIVTLSRERRRRIKKETFALRPSPNTVSVNKSTRCETFSEHGRDEKFFKSFRWKPGGQTLLGICRRELDDDIKTDISENNLMLWDGLN